MYAIRSYYDIASESRSYLVQDVLVGGVSPFNVVITYLKACTVSGESAVQG